MLKRKVESKMNNNEQYLESFVVMLDEQRKKQERAGKSFKLSITASINQYRSAWNRFSKHIADDVMTADTMKMSVFFQNNPSINVHFIRPVIASAVKNDIENASDRATKDVLIWLL